MSSATDFQRPTFGLGFSVVLILLTALLVFIPRAGHTEFETVLGVDFETMSLDDATLVSGEYLEEGAVYRFDDVITIDDITVRAYVTVTEVSETATLTEFDEPDNPTRFEPTIRTDNEVRGNDEGWVAFTVEFVDQADDSDVALTSYAISGVDIDGQSSYQEFH